MWYFLGSILSIIVSDIQSPHTEKEQWKTYGDQYEQGICDICSVLIWSINELQGLHTLHAGCTRNSSLQEKSQPSQGLCLVVVQTRPRAINRRASGWSRSDLLGDL